MLALMGSVSGPIIWQSVFLTAVVNLWDAVMSLTQQHGPLRCPSSASDRVWPQGLCTGRSLCLDCRLSGLPHG